MPLSPGDKLGLYEILALIGAGGMGEVYRARDNKLKRDVALKVVPEIFASDPERMARFQREAEVLASLNHPNIAQIYGVEDRALIMELVEGENPKGPMPVDTALNYAKQIAEALEAAHDKGIVHRDLKPANIMITAAGVVKVLDFGLAAVTQGSASGTNPANSPTLTMGATQVGMILGTAAYMSPEQARGKPVDKRADIWAFGVVLYEMVTGQQLFQGEDVSHTLASVIMKEPDLEPVSPNLRQLLERCLEKDPKKRLRDIGDLDLLLAAAPPPPAVGTSPSRSPGKGRWISWGVAAFLGVAAAAAGFGWWRATRPVSHSLVHLSVDLGADAVVGQRITGVLSPDGTRIVFPIAPRSGGAPQLATRLLDQPKATPVFGSEYGANPFFSPDGRWIGFFSGGKLKKVAAQGGAPVTLCDAPNMAGGSWGEDGNIVFSSALAGLMRVSDAGGQMQPLTKVSDSGEIAHVFPQILPGGAAVLFGGVPAGAQSTEDADIEVLTLKTGRKKALLHGGYFAQYLPTSNGSGHVVYLHEGTLFGVAFDPDRLEVRGKPAPLLEDIAANPNFARGGQFAFSQTGTLVYLSGQASTSYPVVWLDSAGKTTPLVAQPGVYDAPRFSPDGKHLAYLANAGKGEDVFVYDLASGASTQLTFTVPGSYELAWAPDGKHLVFGAGGAGGFALWWIRADRSGEPQKLLDGKTAMRPQSFSPDGKRLAYVQNTDGRPDIWMLPVDLADSDHPKPGKPEAYLISPLIEVDAAFSPDGRWLAYSSNEASSADEIYVRPAAAGAGGKWRISTKGGKFPAWSRDGRLFFLGGDDRIMVTDYTAKGEAFTPGLARVWSEKQIQRRNTRQNFDLAPDAKRVAAIPRPDAEENAGTLHVTFLLNFFDEVRRRVPVGK